MCVHNKLHVRMTAHKLNIRRVITKSNSGKRVTTFKVSCRIWIDFGDSGNGSTGSGATLGAGLGTTGATLLGDRLGSKEDPVDKRGDLIGKYITLRASMLEDKFTDNGTLSVLVALPIGVVKRKAKPGLVICLNVDKQGADGLVHRNECEPELGDEGFLEEAKRTRRLDRRPLAALGGVDGGGRGRGSIGRHSKAS